MTTANSGTHAETIKVTVTRPGITLGDLRAEYERPLRQRGVARATTSTKLVLNQVRSPLVPPWVDGGKSMGEALTRIMDKLGEQQEQFFNRMSELERAIHIEREGLREDILRNKQ